MCWKIARLIPKKLQPHKISWKIALTYAALFSAVLIVLNGGTLLGIRIYLVEQAKHQVQSTCQNTANVLRTVSDTSSLCTKATKEFDEIRRSNSSLSIRLTDTAGKSLVSVGDAPFKELGSPANVSKILTTESSERHLVLQNVKVTNTNGSLQSFLQVCYDMHSEYRFIKLLFVRMAFADFLGLLISIFVGRIISARTLKPIDNLTQTALEISSGDLKNRVSVSEANDELSRLATTFNQMIEKLQNAFEKQTCFVSDASHELRTPIAVIQGYADMIMRWGKNDPEVLQEAVTAIYKETNDMASLVEKLLFLAKGDNNRFQLEKTSFDLRTLLEEVVGESRLVSPQHSFACEVQGAPLLQADRKLVKQALRALLDNSIKYTPQGGRICVTGCQEANSILLKVKDTGQGIAPEELPKLFDRFYRADKGRSKETGGSGLGLSIVKLIVETHGGTIWAESQLGHGMTVILRFPIE